MQRTYVAGLAYRGRHDSGELAGASAPQLTAQFLLKIQLHVLTSICSVRNISLLSVFGGGDIFLILSKELLILGETLKALSSKYGGLEAGMIPWGI